MRKQVKLPTPKMPIIALNSDIDELIDLFARAANGDPDIEIGADEETARQINSFFNREIVHTYEEDS